jgi:hypothetical protein
LVFLAAFFLLTLPPTSYVHISSPPFVLHALPISSSLKNTENAKIKGKAIPVTGRGDIEAPTVSINWLTDGKRPLGRPRCTWVNNIRIDLREIGLNRMNWIDLAQDKDQWRALVNAVMNLRIP